MIFFSKTTALCFLGIVSFFSLMELHAQQEQVTEEQTETEQEEEGDKNYIITASEFMRTVADHYGKMNDLQALLVITRGSVKEYSELYVKPPTKMLIAYKKPAGQVISSNGEDFYVYLPNENIVLHQKRGTDLGSAGTFVTRSGLDILLRNYSISYVDSPYFVPLDTEGNDGFLSSLRKTEEKRQDVVQIRLRRRSSTQSFKEIILNVGRDNLIHRVSARTFSNQRIQFDFMDMLINEGIPDSKFDFDPPPTAPVIDNLFYKETAVSKDDSDE